MPVCRLIFRLDYKVKFDIFDNASKIMHLMNEQGDDFWNVYNDDPTKRTITAVKESNENFFFRALTVTPIHIDCNLERHEGIELAGLENDPMLTKIIKITNSVRKEFKINDLVRSGLRIFYLDKLELGKGSITKAIEKLISPGIIKDINGELGQISDIGFAFDVEHGDKIHYHYRFGPYFKGEAKKYLTYQTKTFDKNIDFNFVADIDLYEMNFSIAESVNYLKWCRPIFEKANNSIENTKKIIIETGGE